MARVFDIVFSIVIPAAVAVATLPTVAVAQECSCRAPGRRVELGGTACLPTPNGPRLARCVMDVNITSWKFLDTPCPTSSAPLPPSSRPAVVALAERDGQ